MHEEDNNYENELCSEDSESESECGFTVIESHEGPPSQVHMENVICTDLQPSSSTSLIQLSSFAPVPHPISIPTVQEPISTSTFPHPISTLTVPQPISTSTVLQPSSCTSVPVPNYQRLSRLEEHHNLKEELSLVQQTKIICSLDLLIDLFKHCQYPGCSNGTVVKHFLIGPTAVIKWTYSSGHRGTFCSSMDQNEIYSNHIQVAASILLSGNNFAKQEKLAKFLGLSFLSESTFYRMQRVYFIPAINEWWNWQREQLLEEFKDKDVIVCGDGQCDSPGHTAKNLLFPNGTSNWLHSGS